MPGDELLGADLCLRTTLGLWTQILTQFSVQLQGSEAPGYNY